MRHVTMRLGAKGNKKPRWRAGLKESGRKALSHGCLEEMSGLRRLGVRFHAYAAAHEVAVAVDVVDAADGRPELGSARPLVRERGGLAGVRVRPLGAADHGRSVRGVLQWIVGLVGLTTGDGRHLTMDGDERIAEAVELGLRLALGRLDHERAGDGEGHRRGVIAIVHQALRDVLDLEAVLLPRAEFEDALV